MRTRIKMFVGSLVMASTLCASMADQMIVPPGFENQEGSGGTSSGFTTTGTRWLSRVPSTAFILPVDTYMRIEGVSFRIDSTLARNVEATNYRVMINLSSSNVTDRNSFEKNHGPDRATVFDGAVRFEGRSVGQNIPGPFIQTIVFQSPFNYDPSSGSLVMDYHNIGVRDGSGITLDIANPDPQQYWSLHGSLSGGQPQNLFNRIFLTKVSYTLVQVPEPAGLMRLTAGLLFLAAFCNKRRVA